MDTEYDFITPEFLHLLFFRQKNLVIFPHVDFKHLNSLGSFCIGYNVIDLESTALHDLPGILEDDKNESYSKIPNLYLIYNLDRSRMETLLSLKKFRMILNVNQKYNPRKKINRNSFSITRRRSAFSIMSLSTLTLPSRKPSFRLPKMS
ncbi:MAG: hypothetical protein GF311_06405 [Candidatus Lokiarchaeota archaeon]|nr:hypothetical protein [Candidatus Lokiarchaeota archaeon]